MAFVDVAMSSAEKSGLSMVQDIPQILVRPIAIAVPEGAVANNTLLVEE